MTLTEFLLARIAEDEATARDASVGHEWTWDEGGDELLSDHRGKYGPECIIDTEGANPPGSKPGAHIARHDPARVLADCEAKRRIITEHEPVDYSNLGMKSPNACSLCGADLGMSDWEWERDSFPCATLRALALPYADHPDYREEWKP